MTNFVRVPLVAFAYLVERLRRLPVAGSILRHTSLVAGALVVGAALAFAVWAGTVAPQRVGLGDLVQGNLSHMQTWIIVSGDLAAGAPRTPGFRYVLTDPGVANARMNVLSDVELPLGYTTVSGIYVAGQEPVPIGYPWIGTMHADEVVAAEPGPPLVALILLTTAVLLVAAGRVSYPMFFGQSPRSAVPRATTIPVGIRRGPLTTNGASVPGTLALQPGAPVGLRVSGDDVQPLRLHSVHTGVDVGELRHVSSAEPALQIRLATDELTLSFDSVAERDAAFSALIADAQQWSQAAAPRPTGSPHGQLR